MKKISKTCCLGILSLSAAFLVSSYTETNESWPKTKTCTVIIDRPGSQEIECSGVGEACSGWAQCDPGRD